MNVSCKYFDPLYSENPVRLFPRNLNTTQSHIRLNLVTSLVIAQLVFMAGINATAVKVIYI